MDNFIVSARKYRPATFDTVVGQQHITLTLKNAIKNNQLAQAFLFCGPRGVGKTTCARILARTINCEAPREDVEACGQCDSCRSFQQGTSFSIHELDAASNNTVEDIRNLIDQVRIPPQTGRYKIYIIDEVHMLSQSAFNAFLKTLEEPPAYAIFILATTEKHKILPTILSRCQIFDFNRISVADMARHLAGIAEKEGVSYEPEGLHVIAQKADGGLRDALSMFDQIVSFSNKQLTYQAVIDNLHVLDYDYYFRVTDAIIAEDSVNALLILDDILSHGFDGGHFISGLASHFRDLLVARDPATVKLLETSDAVRERYLQQAQRASAGLLLSALNIANQCEINYRTTKNQRLQVELALLKMCHIASAIQIARNGSAQPMEAAEKKKYPDAVGSDGTAASNSRLQTTTTPSTPAADAPATLPVSRPASQAIVTAQATSAAPVADTPTARPSVAAEPGPASPQSSPTPERTATGNTGNWSSVKLRNAIPDLNQLLNGTAEPEAEDEPRLLQGDAREPFTHDDLLKHWHELADNLKAANRINLFTLMTANAPQLMGDGRVGVVVENPIQLELLNNSKIDILNELRARLRNFAVDLVPIEVKLDNHTRKPYTAQEKYQAMVAKNPTLDVLRRTFNLGLE